MTAGDPGERSGGSGSVFAVIAGATLAIGCCAALPLVVAALGGASLGVIFGIGFGLIGLVTVLGGVVVLIRRRSRETYTS